MLYALRDVTGTVESIPLITRVDHEQEDRRGHRRAGDGREERPRRVHEDARRTRAGWPSRWSSIGNANGVRTEAIITAMDAPLGRAVGNALEVIECIETLKGRGPADLTSCRWSWRRGCWCSARVAADRADGAQRVRAAHRLRRRARAVPAHHRSAGRRSARRRRLLPVCPRRRIVSRSRRDARRVRHGDDAGADRPRVGRARRRPRPRRGCRRSGRRHRRAMRSRAMQYTAATVF